MYINGTIMQYFHEDLTDGLSLWAELKKNATKLSKLGITATWLPPALKGALGVNDTGYTPYDLYDIGEFDQKGSIATKYGTKNEYTSAIKALQSKNINVYAEVVINKLYGADSIEKVDVDEFDAQDSVQMVGKNRTISGSTDFKYIGREKKYSTYSFCWKDFDGINWNKESITTELDKYLDDKQKAELDNADFVMTNKLNYSNEKTRKELLKWGQWYQKTTNIDGISFEADEQNIWFYKELVKNTDSKCKKDFFSFAKLWHWDVNKLTNYVDCFEGNASVLDVPLHFNLHNCSKAHGNYDLRTIFDGTLVKTRPLNAITFVDNYDSMPGRVFDSAIEDWFKVIAYSIVLLRQEGYPCLSYEDYSGSKDITSFKKEIDKLMKLRLEKAYGVQHDYLDDPNCIGWTREGDSQYPDSGIAVVISDGTGGTKRMYIGKHYAGAHFSDAMGNAKYNIKIDEEGYGNFYVNRGAVAVWIRKENKSR